MTIASQYNRMLSREQLSVSGAESGQQIDSEPDRPQGPGTGSKSHGPREPFRAASRVVQGALPDRNMIAGDDSLPLFAEYKVDDFLYRRVIVLPEE